MTCGPGTLLVGLVVLAGHASAPSSAAPSRPSGFESLARRAGEAREQGRLRDATELYRQAVALRPEWAEGWWYLGTLAYDADRHEECAEALERLTAIDPKLGPAWGIRGLCEFSLGRRAAAERHLDRALETGPVADEPIWRVVLYHVALLRIRAGEFERAIPPLRQLAEAGTATPEVLDACGLRLLRRKQLPADVAPADRALVRGAGRAECATLGGRQAEAAAAFQDVLAAHPTERHLHYGYGLLLAQKGSAEAIDAHRREVELYPDHVLAHVELAFNLLTHGRPAEARDAAEAAVRLDPRLFAAHLALGRARVALGDPAGGVSALETAARLAPGVPETQLALSRAYAAAGREKDAERASARFRELDARRRSQPGDVPRRATP